MIRELHEQTPAGERIPGTEWSDQQKLEGLLTEIKNLQTTIEQSADKPGVDLTSIQQELNEIKAAAQTHREIEGNRNEIASLKKRVGSIRGKIQEHTAMSATPIQTPEVITVQAAKGRQQEEENITKTIANADSGIPLLDQTMDWFSKRIG